MTPIIVLSVIILLLVAGCLLLMRNSSAASAQNERLRADAAQRERDLDAQLVEKSAENSRLNERLSIVEAQSERLRADAAQRERDLSSQLMEKSAENSRLNERLSMIEAQNEREEKRREQQFKTLAAEILDSTTVKSEGRIEATLKPLKENIDRLYREIGERTVKDAESRSALQEQIKLLREMNQQISSDAQNLTKALTGNSKIQGDWGEMILEQILECSGLVRGKHFDTQVTRDEAGQALTGQEGARIRPDVIIYLPEGKKVIVDSKVSITHYVRYVAEDDSQARQAALSQHVASVRKHVDELAAKAYQSYITGAADFVLMFIPNEGAYIAAMQTDSGLWQYAYSRKVIIASPTHLISVLMLAAQLWTNDSLAKNAVEIAEAAGRLHDKFAGLLDDLNDVGKALTKAANAHEDAVKKLGTGRGNLITSVGKLKEMGAKANRQLPRATDEDQP